MLAAIAGLIAAWYWLASTKEEIDPARYKAANGREAFQLTKWTDNVMIAAAKASRLNAIAARWTACRSF